MNEIIIMHTVNGSAYEISAHVDGKDYPTNRFFGYSKRLALTLYRKYHGLRRRHLVLIDCTK